MVLTGATFAIIKLCDIFFVERHDIYSILKLSDDADAPKVLETRYALKMDLSSFTSRIITDDDFAYFIYYSDEESGRKITFEQITKETFQSVRLNTENALEQPQEAGITDGSALYFETYYGEKTIIFEKEGYIIALTALNFSKDELIQMTNYVQKAE